MIYLLISNSGADTFVEKIDIDKLEDDIEKGNYGDTPKFFIGVPEQTNTDYWEEGSHLLLKCEIVVPKIQ